MVILVTGATGNVGSQLVQNLLAQGSPFVAGVHSTSKRSSILPENTPKVQVDYEKPQTLNAAFEDIDRLFLLTPLAPEQVDMTKAIVDAAKTHNVKQIVKLSFAGAKSENLSVAGKLHKEAEQYIEESGIPWMFLRPTSFMQNYLNRHAQTIRTQGKFFLAEGHGKVNYVDARDIAATAAAVLTRPISQNQIHYLTGPKPLTGHEVAEILTETLNKPVEYMPVTEQIARENMQKAGLTEWMVNVFLELSREHRDNNQDFTSESVRQLTGKEPTNFRQFVGDFKEKFTEAPTQSQMPTTA